MNEANEMSAAERVAATETLAERYVRIARDVSMQTGLAEEAERRAQQHRRKAAELWAELDDVAQKLREALG